MDGWNRNGSAQRWRPCRCRGPRTGGSCSPWTSARGCARTPRPARNGCSAAVATSWDRVHPRLTRRGCWIDHDGELPVIEGTLIRLQVEHLPGDRDPKPVWLWCSVTGASAADIDRYWQSFL